MRFAVRMLAVIVGACLVAGACGGDNDDGRRESGSPAPTNSPSPGSSTATPHPGRTPGGSGGSGPTTGQPGDPRATTGRPEESSLMLTLVASLPEPIALVARPGTGDPGDLYVATRDGRVWLLTADGDEPPEVVLDVGNLTTTECENGLLGLAFSSDGSNLYIHHTDLEGHNRIVEYPMIGQWVREDQGRRVLSVNQPACNHNGGHLAVGPDGNLWIGLGDGGGADDMFGHGQNLSSLLGTLIRIDPGADGESGYSVPPDNPFTDGGARPEIWAYGARNPWRFSFDRTTGDLWIADVGQNRWEEIHVLAADDGWEPGANLGWPLFEGHERFSGTADPDDLVFPVHVYSHDVGCSITGGHVYRGSAIPDLVGTYVFGDFCTGRLWGLTVDHQGASKRVELEVSAPRLSLVSFGEDAAGELYVLDLDGFVYRLEPAD